MQNLQSYFLGTRFDFPRWLRDQGLRNYGDQLQFIANVTGQYPNIVQQWGNGFEQMPDFFQGMTIGYIMAAQNQPPQTFYPYSGFDWGKGRNAMSQALGVRW
jgi:hypothetical protein